MLTLYYSPGACFMAPHIALEEAGAPYTLQLVSIAKGEHQGPEYLNVNSRGKVPALRTDEGVLTENVAILTYIARSFHAGASGGPQGARARAEPAAPGLRHRSMSPLCHAWGRRSERHAVDQQLIHHRRREQCLMSS
jgi:glutathione S-transferase